MPCRAFRPASRESSTSWASAIARTLKGKIATFTLGYSHPIEVLLPDGVDLKIDKQTHLVLTGYDKQMLGQVAANIRALRKPDPYKNKGVRYMGEVLKKKVGKSGATGAQEVNDSQDLRKTRSASASISAFARSCAAPPSGRASPFSAAPRISTRR